MRIDELSTLLTTVASPRVTSVLNAWRAGQILEAVVTRVSNVGTATLNVNDTPIDVRTTMPLTVGARLLLEVAHLGKQPTLRVVSTPTPQEVIARAVRSLAPRQGSLQPVLEQLVRWSETAPAPAATKPALPVAPPSLKPPALAPAPFNLPPVPPLSRNPPITSAPPLAINTPIPPPLRELAQRVVERLATPQQVATPDGLKQAIKDSGAFFEHKLASPAAQPEAQAALAPDVKAALLLLVAALKTMPPAPHAAPSSPGTAPATPQKILQRPASAPPAATLVDTEALLQSLGKDADAAVARVTLQQLLSLPENKTDAPQWIFDVPVRWGETINIFHLHVFREKHPRDPQQPPAWCVRLSFDLVTLGEVGVLVTLLGGAVSLSIWAQQPATAALFTLHVGELQSQLREAGVALNRVSCECGAAPFSADTPLAQKQRHLIDERA